MEDWTTTTEYIEQFTEFLNISLPEEFDEFLNISLPEEFISDGKNGSFSGSTFFDIKNDCAPEPLILFLIQGVGVLFVSLTGIIGNIITLIVLTRKRMTSSTNILLTGLCISDTLLLFLALMGRGIQRVCRFYCFWPEYYNVFLPVFFTIVPPLAGIAQLGSIYFTMLVTIERFIVVYMPLRARFICTVKNATKASFILAGFAILYTSPKWFEMTYEDNYLNGTWAGYKPKLILLANQDYVHYYLTWSSVFVILLIPFCVLAILNLAIYKKIREANTKRKIMTMRSSNSTSTNSHCNDNSITKMLLCVVTVFLVCYIPAIFVYMRETIRRDDNAQELLAIADFLITLNSAVNFIIYCVLGEKFRKTFLKIFCCRPSKMKMSQSSRFFQHQTSMFTITSSRSSVKSI